MPLLRRFAYFLGGFSIGIVILAFIWKKKGTEICYLPNCRVLKDIRLKKLNYLNNFEKDSSAVKILLRKGDVIFSKSDTKSSPCKTYFIKGKVDQEKIEMKIQNCEKEAVVQEFIRK